LFQDNIGDIAAITQILGVKQIIFLVVVIGIPAGFFAFVP